MTTTELLFTIANSAILVAWLPLLFNPKMVFNKANAGLSLCAIYPKLFYLYFLLYDGGLAEADFSSLAGILELYRNATPEPWQRIGCTIWPLTIGWDAGCRMMRKTKIFPIF